MQSCRMELTNIRNIRIGAAVGMFACLVVSPLLAILLGQTILTGVVAVSAIASLFGILWLGLGKLEQRLLVGSHIPARNKLEK